MQWFFIFSLCFNIFYNHSNNQPYSNNWLLFLFQTKDKAESIYRKNEKRFVSSYLAQLNLAYFIIIKVFNHITNSNRHFYRYIRIVFL